MLFYKFYGTVAAKLFFFKINIYRAIVEDLFATVISTITENDVLRFPKGGRAQKSSPLGTPLLPFLTASIGIEMS